MEFTYTLSEIDTIAEKILPHLQSKVVIFKGGMGFGKTTLIKALVRALGSTDNVSSPTFSLVNPYEGTNDKIYHFDFYRIKNEEEAGGPNALSVSFPSYTSRTGASSR